MSGRNSYRGGGGSGSRSGGQRGNANGGPNGQGNQWPGSLTGTTGFVRRFQQQARVRSQTNGSRNSHSSNTPSTLDNRQPDGRGTPHSLPPRPDRTPGAWTGPRHGARGGFRPQQPGHTPSGIVGNNTAIQNALNLGPVPEEPALIGQRRNQAPQQQAPPNRPIAQPRGPRLSRRQRRAILNHRTQHGDWRVGDIVHIDYTAQSQYEHSPRSYDSQTGRFTYTVKGLYHVPDIDGDVYLEARFGVIIAIHRGDFGPTATVLPLFSYRGEGTKNKDVEFAIQHLPIVNRSEWADLQAKWADQVRRGILRTVSSDSAVSLVPNDFTLIVDDVGAPPDFTPGKQKSSVLVSKSVTIRLDGRVDFIASLEDASRDRLREFYFAYISMATVEKQELADFDRSKFPLSQFPWLEHMLPRSARSFSFTPPASQADQPNPFTAPPAAPTPATQPTDTPFADAQADLDADTATEEPLSRKRKNPPCLSLTALEKAKQYLDDQKRIREDADREIELQQRIMADAEVQIRAAGVSEMVNNRMVARRVLKENEEAHRAAEEAIREAEREIREAEERLVELEAYPQQTESEEQVQESASKRRKFKEDDDEEIQSAVRIPSP